MGNGMQTKVQSKNIDRYSVREMGSVYYQKYREENNGTIGCDMVWRRADVKFFLSEYVIDMNGKIIYYEIISQDIVLDLDYRFVNGYKRSPHNELLNISLKGENKYLMKNLNCKRCKSAFQNYVYMCYVNVSNSNISVFYIIWIALQALSTQLNKSISYFRECSSIMSYNQMSICNEK